MANTWSAIQRTCAGSGPILDEKEKAEILYAERVTRGAAGIRDASLTELRTFFAPHRTQAGGSSTGGQEGGTRDQLAMEATLLNAVVIANRALI